MGMSPCGSKEFVGDILHGKAVLLSNLSGKNTTFLWIK